MIATKIQRTENSTAIPPKQQRQISDVLPLLFNILSLMLQYSSYTVPPTFHPHYYRLSLCLHVRSSSPCSRRDVSTNGTSFQSQVRSSVLHCYLSSLFLVYHFKLCYYLLFLPKKPEDCYYSIPSI